MENRAMRCTIGRDKLDITEWEGKMQRLQTRIDKEVHQRHLDDTLPYKLIMTMEQYEMLKNTIEFGGKGEWRTYKPHQRVYVTPDNAMEIIIK
jgi:hypothetical protein